MPFLLLLDTSFCFPFYAVVQLCWTLSNSTEPTHQSPNAVFDFNHALTPMKCDVPVHMQCDAPLHVIFMSHM